MKKGCTAKAEQGRRINPSQKTKDLPPVGGMLHLLSIGRGLYDACGVSMTGPVSEWPVPELPQWVKNICEQLRLTIFKRYLELKPQGESVDWRKIGRVLGVGRRELGFAKHDSLSEKEIAHPNGNIEASGLEQILLCLSEDNRAETLVARVGKLLENSIALGLAEKPEAQHEFLAGLAEGHELFLDVQGQLVGGRGRTTAYFELLSRW
jgi:hypothetical protein